jgi:hypothetical protein
MLVRPGFRTVLILLAFCLFGAAAASSPALADWSPGTPLSDPFATEDKDSVYPAVAVAPGGATLVVWHDRLKNRIRYVSRPAGGKTFGSKATATQSRSSLASAREASAA